MATKKFAGSGGKEFESVHRARINGGLLPQYHGKPICLLGNITKADGGGTAFQIRSSDNVQLNVRLKTPINEPLSGLVEVYGLGQGKNLILADRFTTFPDSVSENFDMTSYNEVVKILNTLETGNPWKPF